MAEQTFLGIRILTDETLPPNYVKALNGGEAFVWRLDIDAETATPIASWPEKSSAISEQEAS